MKITLRFATVILLAATSGAQAESEPPYTRNPLYKFAKDYCEKNKLSMYQYTDRYVGNEEGIFASVIATKDGGALLVATVEGEKDAAVIRFDKSRKVLWKKTFRKAGKPAIEGHAAVELPDGSFYVDLGPYAHPATANQIWILKLDGTGKTIWEVLYRGTGNDNNPTADRLQLGPNKSIKIFGHIYPTLADIRAEKSFGWTSEINADGKVVKDETAKTDVNYSNDETAERYPF